MTPQPENLKPTKGEVEGALLVCDTMRGLGEWQRVPNVMLQALAAEVLRLRRTPPQDELREAVIDAARELIDETYELQRDGDAAVKLAAWRGLKAALAALSDKRDGVDGGEGNL